MDNPAFVSEKDDKNKNYDITNVNVVNVTNNRGLNNQAKAVESNEWGPDWERYSNQDKLIFVLTSMLKSILAIFCLYLFLLSLNFMSIGFTMISSYAIQAGGVIGFLLSNPFASLAVGIIVTATMQNATATTSIAIILVGAGIIPSVKSSVPIIMGANIGTCVTNSFVALTMADDPNEFKRAFSAATLNDGFNLLTTLIFLPIEIVSGFLFVISDKVTNALPLDNPAALASANFIGVILNPICDLFIKLNSTAVDLLSNGDSSIKNVALRCCLEDTIQIESNKTLGQNASSFSSNNLINLTQSYSNLTFKINQTICLQECTYWCMPMLRSFGDGGTGLFWVIFSILVLLASLFSLVKAISLLICGPISKNLGILLTKKFPKPFHWVSQIILFIIALLLTVIVQSSNIITATLVPLCGIGIISLQQVYVMTLGSNIGTTVTGILTALTQPSSSLKKAMQLAFVYTFFNTLGVILWLPISYFRIPKKYARKLGEVVFMYRWFLYLYVSNVYFILPLILFGIALIPYWIGLAVFGIPIILIATTFITIKILQLKLPNILPNKLKTFDFLPTWLTSLRPYDRNIKKLKCCRSDPSNIHSPHNGFAAFVRRTSTIGPIIANARRFSVLNPVDEDLQVPKDAQGSKNLNDTSENNTPKINNDSSTRF